MLIVIMQGSRPCSVVEHAYNLSVLYCMCSDQIAWRFMLKSIEPVKSVCAINTTFRCLSSPLFSVDG